MSTRIRLLAVDAELAEAVPAAERASADQLLIADARRLETGPWMREDEPDGGRIWLVLAGAIMRVIDIDGRRSAQILGPGDVLGDPWSPAPVVPHGIAWHVLAAGAVADLADRIAVGATRWPALQTVMQTRLLAQADRLAFHLAIAQLPRVEQRILGILWHLADRWGKVTPNGIVVPLPLTHGMLGELIGAQRPTVSLGLMELQKEERVSRIADGGGWLLDPESRSAISRRGGRDPDVTIVRAPVAGGQRAAALPTLPNASVTRTSTR